MADPNYTDVTSLAEQALAQQRRGMIKPSTVNAAAASTNAAAADPNASPTIANSGRTNTRQLGTFFDAVAAQAFPTVGMPALMQKMTGEYVTGGPPGSHYVEGNNNPDTGPHINWRGVADSVVGNPSLRSAVGLTEPAGSIPMLRMGTPPTATPTAAAAGTPAAATPAARTQGDYPIHTFPGDASGVVPKTYQQADVRNAERGVYSSHTPAVSKQAAGQGTTGDTSPGGTGFTATPTSGAGIQRVDVAGQSPLFTNLNPGFALDDINRKRSSPLPSVAGFMNTVKPGSLGLLAPSAVPQGYGEGGGMQRSARAQQLFDQADTVASSGGIVDLWKARGMRRTAQAMDERALHADTNAISAQGHDVQRRGQDLTYQLGQQGHAVQSRGQDLGFLPHIGNFAIGMETKDALQKGDYKRAAALQQLDNTSRTTTPSFQHYTDPQTGKTYAFDQRTGTSRLVDPAAAAAGAAQEAGAAALAKEREKK